MIIYIFLLFCFLNSCTRDVLYVYTNMRYDLLHDLEQVMVNKDIVFYPNKDLFYNISHNNIRMHVNYKKNSFKFKNNGMNVKEKNIRNGVYNITVNISQGKKNIYKKKFVNSSKREIIGNLRRFIDSKLLYERKKVYRQSKKFMKSKNSRDGVYVKKLIVSSTVGDVKSNIVVKDFLCNTETVIAGVKYLKYLNLYGDDLIFVANNKLKYYALNGGKKNSILKNITRKHDSDLFFQPKLVDKKFLLTTLVDKKNFSSRIVQIDTDSGDSHVIACSKKIFLNPIKSGNSVFFQMLESDGCLYVYQMNLLHNKVKRLSRESSINNINMSLSPSGKKLAIIQQVKDSSDRIMSIFNVLTGRLSKVFKSSGLSCDIHFFTDDEIAFHDKEQKSILSYNCKKRSIKKIFTSDGIQSFYIQ